MRGKHFYVRPGLSIHSSVTDSRGITGVCWTGRDQLTSKLCTATHRGHPKHALASGLGEADRKGGQRCRVSKCPDIYWESLILVLIQSPKVWFCSSSEQVSASCFCRRSPNLVGPFEDTDGWVNGTPSVVVGARVLGYADSAVALIVWLAGAADLWPLCRALGVDITVIPWAKSWAGMKRW